MTIREKVMSEVSGFPNSKLYAIQGYINFLDSRKEDFYEECYETEKSTPLDDFDYELALRAELHKNEETIPFDEVLKMFGMTLNDIQD